MEIKQYFGGFQMKTIGAFLIMVCLCAVTLFALDGGDHPKENKSFISTIIDGLVESTRSIHEINQDNLAAVREETKANFEAATAPKSGMAKLNGTKGFWNKVIVIFENMIEAADKHAETERTRRVQIQSHSSYKAVLGDQKTGRQATIN